MTLPSSQRRSKSTLTMLIKYWRKCSPQESHLNWRNDYFTDTTDYHEHVVWSRQLEIASHTADAIQELKQPRNITTLRFYQQLCNFFREFVSNFARNNSPLNRKLQKNYPKEFGPLNEPVLPGRNTLEEKANFPQILALPYGGVNFMLIRHMQCAGQLSTVLRSAWLIQNDQLATGCARRYKLELAFYTTQ